MARPSAERRSTAQVIVGLAAVATFSCRFDPSYRDVGTPVVEGCSPGQLACEKGQLVRCAPDGLTKKAAEDCAAKGLVCAPTLLACTVCEPSATRCDGAKIEECSSGGDRFAVSRTCDAELGEACRDGVCVNLCEKAASESSNVGCEYWAADLDNAVVSASLNAAAQQFAVVVSNVDALIPARVTVEEEQAGLGEASRPRVVATATVAPRNLEVFRLGPREIDGSAEGTFDTGTGTHLSRQAYRITSTAPIVAYQFNPLENANVFSNDASQLLPATALGGSGGRAYVVAGWGQTIATSDNPSQNFGQNLRAFLAIVGTRPNTRVKIKTQARVVAGPPFPEGLPRGAEAEVVLQPFDVLNLETGDFNADFTGTLIDSTAPVAVFPGSEASDAPLFDSLSSRFCCADHLEEQGVPLRAAGKRFVLAHAPNRTQAVAAAGGEIGIVPEPEYVRVVSTRSGKTKITTTLPPPFDRFELDGEGSYRTLVAEGDLTLEASEPVIVADVQASQEAAGIVRGLPGGDPSLTFVPPTEQWRRDYVFLTPDKYAFDFLIITAPRDADLYLDGLPVDPSACARATLGEYATYRCQLSFPVIDPNVAPPNNVQPGSQNDGVHRIQSSQAVGIIAYGFDSFVSYAYAAGTELRDISVR